jgi:hypothetical protein
MVKFGLPVVALLTALSGALGWAVIAGPGQDPSGRSEPATLPSAVGAPSTSGVPEAGKHVALESPDERVPTPKATVAVPAGPVVPIVDATVQSQTSATPAPSQVRVATLRVDATVVPVGLDDAGSMMLPPDPAIAGWYEYGPAPASSAGATVIAAHVDSLTYGLGPFAALADAAPGTEIVVTDTAGHERTYAVASIETTEKGDVAWTAIFDRTGPARLVLVTCGGEFDYSTRHYLSNVIVVATPVG